MGGHIIVLTTVPGDEEGTKLARELVGRRLAACVNLAGPVRSVYRWKGEIQEETELLLVIKTVRENFDRVRETIAKIHSSELPEVVAIPIEAGEETYLNWITAQSSDEPAELP